MLGNKWEETPTGGSSFPLPFMEYDMFVHGMGLLTGCQSAITHVILK